MKLKAWFVFTILLLQSAMVLAKAQIHNQTIPKTVVNEETGSVLTLRGVSVCKQYAKEDYIGAFYSQAPITNPQEALADEGPRRMVIIYLNPKDNIQSYWRNAIKLNNSPEVLEQEQLKVNQFLKMINYKVQAGDTLLIEFVPNLGTKVVIKGSFKGTVRGNEFFNLVLKTWVGRFPPSEKFRYDLFNLTKGFTY